MHAAKTYTIEVESLDFYPIETYREGKNIFIKFITPKKGAEASFFRKYGLTP